MNHCLHSHFITLIIFPIIYNNTNFIQNIYPMYEDDKIILLIIIIDDLKKKSASQL